MESKEYWNARYAQGGNSGYGSYGEQLAKKLAWLCPLEFNSITEIGCGDFNFGKNLLKLHPATYAGFDIAPSIIEANTLLFPQHSFTVIQKDTVIPPADLVLCVDVLFHVLEESELESLFKTLEQAWTKYLVVTAYEYDQPSENHVRIRKFDPARFGVPILREVVEEDGQLYFYIFEKAK